MKNLKIPDSNPAWSHVLYRDNGASSPNPGQKPTNGIIKKGKAGAGGGKGGAGSGGRAKETEITAKSEMTPPPARQYPPPLPHFVLFFHFLYNS